MDRHPSYPLPDGISLRTLGSADGEFSLALFKETTAPEFEMLGMTDEQLEPILNQQFEIRDSQWRQRFPDAVWSIICDGARPIGEWCVDESEECLTLINVVISPEFRGRGIAAALVRKLFAEAQQADKFVAAHVAQGNPAREIWFHLGFEIVEDTGAHYRIEWRPPPA